MVNRVSVLPSAESDSQSRWSRPEECSLPSLHFGTTACSPVREVEYTSKYMLSDSQKYFLEQWYVKIVPALSNQFGMRQCGEGFRFLEHAFR
jgi:hypothetical protein